MTKRRLKVILLVGLALAGVGSMGLFAVGSALSCGGLDIHTPPAMAPPPVDQPLAQQP